MQTLPSLVRNAVTFSLDPRLRSLAGTVVTNLHTFAHLKGTRTGEGALGGHDRRLDRIDEIKKKIDWQVDESTLNNKLKESSVSSNFSFGIVLNFIELITPYGVSRLSSRKTFRLGTGI